MIFTKKKYGSFHIRGSEFKLSSIILLLVAVCFVGIKALNSGYDANVYLFAAGQLFNHQDIYSGNPFNFYLYSPLFALIISPLTLLGFDVARVVFALVYLALTIRMGTIVLKLIDRGLCLPPKVKTLWMLLLLFVSLGFLIHNLNLGQITILILWLTLESVFQILHNNRKIWGSALLALGINIKIIPLLALYYLFFKGRIRESILVGLFLILTFLIPAIFIGFQQNIELHHNWFKTINPSREKYVFENNGGTQSLNAILPAYFYNFNDGEVAPANLPRVIVSVDYQVLKNVLQVLRIALALSVLFLIWYTRKYGGGNPLFIFWELAYLGLITALIFPHQQKYAMLYFAPAAAYIILFQIVAIRNRSRVGVGLWIIAGLSSVLMWLIATMGRDIYGELIVNISDYYHFPGLNNLVFVVLLLIVRPDKILKINENSSLAKEETIVSI